MICKKLIEVAMPVKEVSAESVRDKSIRHGHISTLHLWWARRPLPVCRAVVFASLVPDPLDEKCPQQFKDAVGKLLSGNLYKPYEDIPFTAAADKMDDNPRNRLLMFIGKFSQKFIQIEKTGEGTCPPKETLDAGSLIKWENKNNEHILNIARKLIFIAHNHSSNKSYTELLNEFEKLYSRIKDKEKELYNLPDRHLQNDKGKKAEQELADAIENFLDKMPKVYDPFAGGGAIPLEAARLGCRTYANDLNPVAHIIEKTSLEFPQKFGKPIYFSKEEFIRIYGKEEFEKQKEEGNTVGNQVYLLNRLAFDVKFLAKRVLNRTEKEVGHLYINDEKGNKPVAYYWARTGKCSNPSCKAEIPLVKNLYLCDRPGKRVGLKPIIDGKDVHFKIVKGNVNSESWLKRGNVICPICGNMTSVDVLKDQFVKGKTNQKIVAMIYEGNNKKEYREPSEAMLNLSQTIELNDFELNESMPVNYTQAMPVCTWGFSTWGDLFSDRQKLFLSSLVKNIRNHSNDILLEDDEYYKCLRSYLSILLDRIAVVNTTFSVWHNKGEKISSLYGRQAISMVFDYVESNPFCDSSGSANNQLDWIIRYIISESENSFIVNCILPTSGDNAQFKKKSLNSVITDPPYYDAMAYADLSDFFYVWLKRSLIDVYPELFSFPLTPKSDECTALKHHQQGNVLKAKEHFENKLASIFKIVEMQTEGVVSIMFAHQSVEAWTTLCNSILSAQMNICGSWASDTELTGALKTDKAFLASSITVACRPSARNGIESAMTVKKSIEMTVNKEVLKLYQMGFRGADLLTACFGPAVSEFGKYEKVEKASGEEVTVEELLSWARDAAFNAIVSDINTDDYTRFYIGWLNLFGFSTTEHDDVRRITQIGLSINVNELLSHNLIIRDGSKQTLATFKDRASMNKKLGDTNYSFTIDKVHKAMYLLNSNNRKSLLSFINENVSNREDIFWRVCNSLKEVLPKGMDDQTLITELIANKDNLIKEARGLSSRLGTQEEIFN